MSSRYLSDWIDGFMDYSENSEPPKSYRLWSAISVISAALQRKCYLEWGSLTFYPNMYVVLVGPSGKCRKGTAMGFASEFINELQLKLAAESITREALIMELKNATDSVQLEQGVMEFHSSLTVFAPELTVFLGYNNHTLMSDMTDWYDCRSKWTYRTKHQGTDEITGVYVTLFGATTPELIRTTLPLDAIGGGLTSRMIFVYEQRKGKTVPAPFLSDEEVQLGKMLKSDIEKIHCLKGKFKVTSKFVNLWTDWYTAQEDNPPFNDHRFAGYIERRPNHAMKLACICNASRSDKMIVTDKDLQRAIDILEFTERKMIHTFSGVGQSTHADTLTRVMQVVASKQEVAMSDLQKMFYFDVDSRTLSTIIETLKSMKYLQVIRRGNDQVLKYTGEGNDDASVPAEDVPANRGGDS